jgi:DNA invertase Pin-like site-specific DNA recombinase
MRGTMIITLQTGHGPLYIRATEDEPAEFTRTGKLTPEQWAEVEDMASQGIPQVDISRKYGISTSSVSRYLAGKQTKTQRAKLG